MDAIENIKSGSIESPPNPDIDSMIETSFWRDTLYEIISTMDPWDIDIAELATRYSKKVDKMQEMNFRIPANVVIVSSVLLRMKAEIAGFGGNGAFNLDEFADYEDVSMDEFECAQPDGGHIGGGNGDMIVPLDIKPKRVPKRRVTAMELIAAIQQVLEDKVIRKRITESIGEKKTIVININTDIRKLIEETYNRVIDILSRKDVALFSELANNRDEVISTFISLLHLSNKQRLKLTQEKIFDEIYIHSA